MDLGKQAPFPVMFGTFTKLTELYVQYATITVNEFQESNSRTLLLYECDPNEDTWLFSFEVCINTKINWVW